MGRPTFRPQIEQLEDRCTPANLFALGGGHSAVTLQVNIQFIPQEPTLVSVSRVLPNGNIRAIPTDPIMPQTSANVPLHDFIPPDPIRGLLQSADVNSSMFIPPGGGGGGT